MNNYEIIDAHVHLHRNITVEKQSFPIPGRRDRDRWGNVDSITSFMDREGISKIVALNLFPTEPMREALLAKLPADISQSEREEAEGQVEKELVARLRRHNEWLCGAAEQNPRLVPSVGIQKLLTPREMVEEVELRVARGARAVKLIPGMFNFYPNDRDFWPMYQRCQELGICVASDTGSVGTPDAKGRYYGEPGFFAEVLESFPKLKLVMCHLASAFWDERVAMAQRYPNLYFDISGSFNAPDIVARDGVRACPEADAVRIMRKVGVERIMFATDGPGIMLQPGLEQFLRLDLTEAEKRLILAENARRIYNI